MFFDQNMCSVNNVHNWTLSSFYCYSAHICASQQCHAGPRRRHKFHNVKLDTAWWSSRELLFHDALTVGRLSFYLKLCHNWCQSAYTAERSWQKILWDKLIWSYLQDLIVIGLTRRRSNPVVEDRASWCHDRFVENRHCGSCHQNRVHVQRWCHQWFWRSFVARLCVVDVVSSILFLWRCWSHLCWMGLPCWPY